MNLFSSSSNRAFAAGQAAREDAPDDPLCYGPGGNPCPECGWNHPDIKLKGQDIGYGE